MQGQRLGGHRFADPRWTYQKEVTALERRDPGRLHGPFLADDPIEGIGGDRDLLRRFDLVEVEGAGPGAHGFGWRHGQGKGARSLKGSRAPG